MQSIIEVMQSQLWFYLITVGLVSLCIGSFLNVVIYRLPIMMQREWQSECRLLLEDELTTKPTQTNTSEPFNLVKPNSTCPKCKTAIKPWQNIPVFSFLLQKGKCANCNTAISARYPLVELATALLSLLVLWTFGNTAASAYGLILCWSLIALTMIDVDHQLLPDNITLPLVWLGLIANVSGTFVDLETAVWGAIAGYLSLWSVFWLFKLLTGKDGMGYGDFKLLAALGAWLGWQMLPLIIILSSLVGAILGSLALLKSKQAQSTPIPFGPYLAVAGGIAMIWGDQIVQAYLNYSGL